MFNITSKTNTEGLIKGGSLPRYKIAMLRSALLVNKKIGSRKKFRNFHDKSSRPFEG